MIVDDKERASSGQLYKLRCGAFKDYNRAETLKARIAFTDYESRIRTSDNQQSRWHIVELGPYERKRHAERDRHALRGASIPGCQILVSR